MNWFEALLITGILLPGIFLMAKNEKKLMDDLLPNEKVPPFWVRIMNHLIIAVPFAFLGAYFFSRAGFLHFSLKGITLTGILLSLICAILHLVYYYGYLIKNLEEETIVKIEKSRNQLGIMTRLLYGGIVEEVIFRFGLMSFFVWIFNLIIDSQLISMWIGNLLAAVLFALAHLPGIYQMKVTITKQLLIYGNSINIMVGLFCGWLYWKEGLLASIVCHMLFHFVWYVYEKVNPKWPSSKIGNK